LDVDDGAVHPGQRSPAQLAVENERLQRALRARLEEEAALRRVATLVAREHEPEAVLALVTEEVARHLNAATAATLATATAIGRCIEELNTALSGLRELARGLHPVVLT